MRAKPVVFFVFILICSVAAGAEVVIHGVVTDQDGQPVADAQVLARAPAMGTLIASPSVSPFSARTDARGYFALPVPFADLLFNVEAFRLANEHASAQIISGNDEPLNLRLATNGIQTGDLRGRVLDDKEPAAPVADLDITVFDGYGFRLKTRTHADGTFVFERIPKIWFPVMIVAEKDGLVLPGEMADSVDTSPNNLKLVPAGRLFGTARAIEDQSPVAGVTVVVGSPNSMSGFERTTKTDASGSWEITGLPPGAYRVVALSEDRVSINSEQRTQPAPTYSVSPGKSVEVPINLWHRLKLSGVVTDKSGHPIEGALVAVPSDDFGSMRDLGRSARTDAAGKFVIHTFRNSNSIPLEAFDAVAGFSRRVEVTLNGIKIVLPGTVRVAGVVNDQAGKGIADVRCSVEGQLGLSTNTTSDGKFDLGRIAPVNSIVHILPPRPVLDASLIRIWEDEFPAAPRSVEDRTYFAGMDLPFDPTSNVSASSLKCALEKTELVVFTGRLPNFGSAGSRSVHLFSGTADERWYGAVPDLGSSVHQATNSNYLTSITVGPDGSFRLYGVRSDGEPSGAGTRFSLGIVSHHAAKQLVPDIIAAPGQREVTISIGGK